MSGNGSVLNVSKIKLSAQIKKAVAALQVLAVSESTVELVVEHLLLQHRDYQLESRRLFADLVRDMMSTSLPVEKPAKEQSVSARLSLNQSIQAVHKALPSKRSRPDNDESSSNTNNNDSAAPVTAAEESGAAGAEGDAASAKAKAKRRRALPNEAAIQQATLAKLALSSSGGGVAAAERPNVRFSDLAGLESVVNNIKELVCYPIQFPQLYSHLGVCPPCGILLHGPSGCGKTTLAAAIAGETGLPYFKASGPELVGGTSGESEERIRTLFEAAARAAPSVLFIDALDVIAGKKDSNTRGMDRRIVAQLFDSIDYISSLGKHTDNKEEDENNKDQREGADNTIKMESDQLAINQKKNKFVVLIVATNKPDNIDPGVRGRFAREIALPVPDAPARTKILQLHTSRMNIDPAVDFSTLGRLTPGFVGADLQALAREAGMIAVCRIIRDNPQLTAHMNASSSSITTTASEGEDLSSSATTAASSAVMEVDEQSEEAVATPIEVEDPITALLSNARIVMEDFLLATKSIQPTAKREGFAVAPEVTWGDIGALSEVREELRHNVLEPIAHPERFRALGLEVPAGVLFYGPPGCGKTLLAKALANQSGANFISVKGPELLNMFVGESESRVRQVFARARASAPCVIFFDELDALCPKRSSGWEGSSGGGGGGNNVSERVVNQLLTELDGLESRKDVYIIAATNRLELIDDAMLRPGRLGNLLYVPLPSATDRASILRALTRKVALDVYSEENPSGVDLEALGNDPRGEGFSGADLSALVREAGLAVIKEISADTPFSFENSMENNTAALHSNDAKYKNVKIQKRHFEAAFARVRPSVNPQDRERYELVRKYLKEGMSAIESLRKAYEDIYGAIN